MNTVKMEKQPLLQETSTRLSIFSKMTSKSSLFSLLSLVATTVLILGVRAQTKTHTGGTSQQVRIQNWNLRYDSKANSETIEETIANLNATLPYDDQIDYFSDYSEAPWSDRRLGVKNEVLFNNPDFFTVNEALVRQVTDLQELLGLEYIGVGRDDGVTSGEFQAIYYDPDNFQLLDNDTFWLSDTPEVPSKYPGAGSYRTCTVGHFRAVSTGVELVILNVHLDDQSDDQRRLGAAMARYRGAYEFEKRGCSVFLVGDFNSNTHGATSGAYDIATGATKLDTSILNADFVKKYSNSLTNFTFDDLLVKTKPENRLGNFATFTGFADSTKNFGRIDFQFGGNPNDGSDQKWEVVLNKVGDNWYDDSYYLSDHRPVISDLIIYN